MMTPVEAHFGKRALDWIKGAASFAWKLGKRVATLEERVTALEEALKSAPADACPFCGERSQRLKHQDLMVKGDRPKQWTEETWTCGKCGKDYVERVRV